MTEEELNLAKEKEIAILKLKSQQKDKKNNRFFDRDFVRLYTSRAVALEL